MKLQKYLQCLILLGVNKKICIVSSEDNTPFGDCFMWRCRHVYTKLKQSMIDWKVLSTLLIFCIMFRVSDVLFALKSFSWNCFLPSVIILFELSNWSIFITFLTSKYFSSLTFKDPFILFNKCSWEMSKVTCGNKIILHFWRQKKSWLFK